MPAQSFRSKIRILIVDDEPMDLKVMQLILKRDFENVVAVESPQKALEMLPRERFHVALINYEMPEMKGTELIRQALKIEPALRSILVTSHQSKEIILEGLRAGFNDYIEKPLNRQLLVHAIYTQSEAFALAENYVKATQGLVEAKTQFLARMSHELRSPMSGIIGITEVLLNTELSPQQQQYVNIIQRSGERLLSVVNEILDFSKLKAGKLTLRRRPLSVVEVVGEACRALRNSFELKGLRCEFTVDPKCHPDQMVMGDDQHLYRVINNLLSNALKFTEKGKVTVSLSSQHLSAQQFVYKIIVADTGVGIPADKCGRIFEEFYQLDTSNTRQYFGTGLGLAICKQLVSLMGGELQVFSVVGEGSQFILSLPYTLSEREACEITASVQENIIFSEGQKRAPILVIDDDPLQLFVAQEIFNELGFENIATSDSAQNALEKTLVQKYALIFTDLQMPQMDGYQFCQTMRHRGHQGPMIGLTAEATLEMRQKCLDSGLNDVINKPYRIEELLRVTSKWL